MRPITILAAMLLAATPSTDSPISRLTDLLAQGSPDPVTLAETLRGEIQAAWLAGDRPRLEAALKLADRATVLYPNNALLHHYLGYAVYRTIQLPKIVLSEQAKTALLTQGLEALATANKLTPMAESYILRWSLMAQTIRDAGSAMGVVGAMQEELAQATRLGKENPRVWLVNGVGSFFTPAMWGGGPETSLEHLARAETLFKNDHPGKAMPDWGRAETCAWLGVVHQKLGHTEESRRAYQEALRLEPGFLWVKEGLLPGLEKGIQPFP
jgi:tetratricopeptide (TPR) repeat protein